MTTQTRVIDVSEALKIDGYMNESDMLWLAKAASEHRVIVEVGSFLGRSTRAMLDNSNAQIYAFDDWYGPREINHASEERDMFFTKFKANTKEYLDSGRLEIIRGNHAEEDLGSHLNPDMVFIDGSHTLDDVIRDIKRWQGRLVRGGLLCGHDYNWWPRVKQAVNSLFPSVMNDPGTDIWYVR